MNRANMAKQITEVPMAAYKKGGKVAKKDACYHKVKKSYKVWPSAYASGALVKCRKVGAANWGNSKKSKPKKAAKGGLIRARIF
jgi:hypothetical protein